MLRLKWLKFSYLLPSIVPKYRFIWLDLFIYCSLGDYGNISTKYVSEWKSSTSWWEDQKIQPKHQLQPMFFGHDNLRQEVLSGLTKSSHGIASHLQRNIPIADSSTCRCFLMLEGRFNETSIALIFQKFLWIDVDPIPPLTISWHSGCVVAFQTPFPKISRFSTPKPQIY